MHDKEEPAKAGLTWGEFKLIVQLDKRVTDDSRLDFIDIANRGKIIVFLNGGDVCIQD